MSSSLLVYFFLIFFVGFQTKFSYSAHLNVRDAVTVSVNKAFSYFSPIESYPYYELVPFCKPHAVQYQPMTFSQLLRGDRHANAPYNISYLVPVDKAEVCHISLDAKTIETLKSYIDQSYMYEIFVDDLPVTKPLGFRSPNGETYWISSHMRFSLGYNDGHVVSANVSVTDELLPLPRSNYESMDFLFRYSVSWFPDPTPVQARLYKQLVETFSKSFHGLNIRWLAITNSFILVLFVFSVLLLITFRIIRFEVFKYFPLGDEELTISEEPRGWKCLYGDVSRPPFYRMWFCACIGAGAQLLLVLIALLLSSLIYSYIEQSTLLTFVLFAYLLTSSVAGYISAYLYRRLGGAQWKSSIIVTVFMFVGPAWIIWFILSLVAAAYGSTRAFPFSITVTVFLFWLFITLPLTLIGSIIGRYRASRSKDVKVLMGRKANILAREIPRCSWKQSPWLHIFLGGLVSFLTIYLELYFVFLSVWGPYSHIMFSVLLCAVATHLMVSGVLSVLIIFYHLNLEDYRWWWRSLLCGGSVGIYFFINCLFHALTKHHLTGLLQYTFYIGFSLLLSWAIFLIGGFTTFLCNYLFISYIYTATKVD